MNGHLILDTPIAVDFWNIRKCASASLFFLSHIHSDHTVGLTSSWSHPIYCSKVTGELLCQKVSLSDDLIRPLELHSPTLIPLNPSHTEMITVTAIDANHCPGSVMFLFQGYFGTILYTGDFRYTSKMFVDSPLSKVSVDVLYLDNTYCDPLCVFGTREEAKEKVFEIIKSYPEHDILLGMQSLGKPDLLIDIAKNLQEYIGVPPLMYKYLEILEVPNVFQVDTPEHECRLRVVPAYYISAKLFSKLTRPTIAVLTTALYVGLEGTPYSNQNSVYIVPYSDHSSYVELQEFVKQTQPGRIVPIVRREAKGPFNVSFAKRANMSCFDHFLSKRPQKPFPIPASIDARSVCQSNDVVSTSKRRKRSLGTTITKSITPKGVIFESSPQKSKNKLNIQKNVAQSRDDSLAPSGSPVKKAIDPDATNSGLKKTCTPEKTTSICVEKPCPPEKTTSICVEKPCPPEKTTSICVEKPCPPEKTTSICVEKPCPLEKTIRICMEILSPLEKTTPICVEKPCPLEKTTESIGISTATIHADVDIPQTEGKSAVSGREADLTKTSIGNTTGMHLQFSNVEPCTKQKSIPDLKGSDSNGNLNPDSCTRANTPNSDPDLGSRANTPNSNLDLGFRANTPNSDPDLGSRANTPNSNPDLGSRANIPNSNPDLGSRANIPNSNPDLGSRANTPNSDPDLGSQANTPNLNPDVITENHPGLSPMSTGSESGRDHHTQETVSDNHPSLTRVQEPARNPEVDENSEKDTSSTNSSVISIVYNIEPAFQIESLNDDVSTQPQMPTRKRKLPPMFDKEFHSLNKRRCPDNWNSDTRRKKASTKGIGLSGSVCIGKQVQNGETDLEGENEVDTEVISVTRGELSAGCVSTLSLLSKTCRPEKSVFTSSISDYVGRFDAPGWTITSCQAVFFDFVKKQRLRYKSETSSLSQVS